MGLTVCQLLTRHEVLKVLVVCNEFHWVTSSFELRAPFFKTPDNG
jgi:hypothetical protein